MGKAFAAAVSSGFDTHQAGVHAVLHIRAQDTVFDQDIFLSRRAFIINRQRPAPVLHRAVIDNGNARRGNALPDFAGERAAALAVEIAFKAMAHRLMQQHTRPAGSKQYRHFASGCSDRAQVGQRLRQCDVNRMFPFMLFKQFVIEKPPAKAVISGFAAFAILRDNAHIEAYQRPHIGGNKAIGADDFNDAPAGRQADAHLRDTRVTRTGGGVDLLA